MTILLPGNEPVRSFRRGVWPTIPAGILGHLVLLVDQIFVSKIGPTYLGYHIYIAYFMALFVVLGRIIGAPLIIINKKEGDPVYRLTLTSSALGLTIFLSLFLGIIIWAGQDVIIPLIGKHSSNYFRIQIMNGTFLAIGTVLTYSLISLDQCRTFLFSSGIIFGINLILNSMSIVFLKRAEWQLMGIGLATTISTLLGIAYQIFKIKKILNLKWEVPWIFFQRARNIMAGDLINALMVIGGPLCLSMMIEHIYARDLASAFNVGLRLQLMCIFPAISILHIGTGELSRLWMEKGRWPIGTYQRLKKEIIKYSLFLSIFPGMIIFIMTPFILGNIYHLSPSLHGFMKIILLDGMIYSLAIQSLAVLRSAEKTYMIGKTELLVTYFISLPLFFWLGHLGLPIMVAFFGGIIVPSLLRSGILNFYARTLENNYLFREGL